MEKRGGLLGEWSNENTRVISYYAKHGDSFAGPFPDPVVFFFHPSNNQLKITTYFHFNLRRTLKSTGYVDVSWKAKLPWARLVRKNMNTVERSRLSFETHYPVYDWDDNQWVYLPVKVSAVKFQEWQDRIALNNTMCSVNRKEHRESLSFIHPLHHRAGIVRRNHQLALMAVTIPTKIKK